MKTIKEFVETYKETYDRPPVLKGLLASILENKAIGNFSNGGISSKVKSVVVVGEGIPEVFEAREDMPAVEIIRRNIGGSEYISAEPVKKVDPDKIGYMMGGSFIYSCDSRFRELVSNYPVPLHDRQETQEQYDALSS